MKLGMCGIRGFGNCFAELFCLHPAVESFSIADLDPAMRERAAGRYELAGAYETLDELLATDIDAVAIFTPPWVHAEQSVQALETGKHVLSACPAAVNLEDLRRVVNAVEKSGCI